MMNNFRELYSADIARYGGGAELYIKVFHFLYRKASMASLPPIRFFIRRFSDYGQIGGEWK